MKKIFLILIVLVGISFLIIYFFLTRSNPKNILSPESEIAEKPLAKYSFSELKNRIPQGGNITIGNNLKTGDGFSSYMFYFETEGKKVSGMINIPVKPGEYPVLVLLRGFIDQQIYTTGDGTRRDGEIFAQNGFITLAPDFKYTLQGNALQG